MTQENYSSEHFIADTESPSEAIDSDTINDFNPAATNLKVEVLHTPDSQQEQKCPVGTADWGACTEIDYASWGGGKGSCLLGDVQCKCDPSMTVGNYGWICDSVGSLEVEVVSCPHDCILAFLSSRSLCSLLVRFFVSNFR